MHNVNKERSSDITAEVREKNAREASKLALDMVRAVVAVCGESVKQTYLHDAFYGMATLYMILGKPYLGATEGNERAHQQMKFYFHKMCSHSNRKVGDVLQTMNLMHLGSTPIEATPPDKHVFQRVFSL